MEEIINQIKQDLLYGTHSLNSKKKDCKITEKDLLLAQQILNATPEVIKISSSDLDNSAMINKKLKPAK